ncbi:MAG: STM4012 family radical SAM protein [Ardenticatenaceae bacterium]
MPKQYVQSYTYAPQRLAQMLEKSPYEAYVYSYPHKTAYRPIEPAVPLRTLWEKESREALFLYVHIPFCEMRCGFCNLFTTVRPDEGLVSAYIETLERQARLMREVLGQVSFARLAIGGGTPTYLSLSHLERVLDMAEGTMGARLPQIPVSVEVSPETATADRLQLLHERGVNRISIGVQSFIDSEVAAIHRRQRVAQVEETLSRIRRAGFATLNIDLMYGLPAQTIDSWLDSIRAALRFHAEEIFLYPLYVRPVTRMGVSKQEWDDQRLACYRAGRDLLLAEGYQQITMRLFRASHAPTANGAVYRCQEDGMVGLGCGARSYTDKMHYSSNYAVGPRNVNKILRHFVETPDKSFTHATYGFPLNQEERRRRYILLSLLSHEGLWLTRYRQRFGTAAFDDVPELTDLMPLGLATSQNQHLRLTPLGMERSDTIGPWLFSPSVRQLMRGYDLQ